MSVNIRKILRLRSQAAAMRVLAEEAPTPVGRDTMHRLAQKLDNLANRTEGLAAFPPLMSELPQPRYLH